MSSMAPPPPAPLPAPPDSSGMSTNPPLPIDMPPAPGESAATSAGERAATRTGCASADADNSPGAIPAPRDPVAGTAGRDARHGDRQHERRTHCGFHAELHFASPGNPTPACSHELSLACWGPRRARAPTRRLLATVLVARMRLFQRRQFSVALQLPLTYKMCDERADNPSFAATPPFWSVRARPHQVSINRRARAGRRRDGPSGRARSSARVGGIDHGVDLEAARPC